MPEALIFDAIRTPRGRGKRDGSLHEVKPIALLSGVLRELQARNDFDTAEIEDVVMGCVTPVGDQGGCIAIMGCFAADQDVVAILAVQRIDAGAADQNVAVVATK